MSNTFHPATERQVQIVCPRCQKKGQIPWDRLNRVLQCCGCDTWYKTDTVGKLIEITPPQQKLAISVRSSFSEWQVHEVTVARPFSLTNSLRSLWRKLRSDEWHWRLSGRQAAAAVTGGATVLVCMVWLVLSSLPAAARTVPPPLPSDLEQRATLLAQTWLAQDMSELLRFIDPVQDRKLRQWFAHNAPPALCGPSATATVEIARLDRGKESTKIDVRIHLSNADGKTQNLTMNQAWQQRDGTWLFQPITAPAPKPAAAKGSKGKSA